MNTPRPALVTTPEALTLDWARALFRHLDVVGEVVGVNTAPIGTGQSAHSERVFLDWAEPGTGPASLVAKLPSPDARSRATGHVHGSYRREVGFYRELRASVHVATPKLIYIDFDDANSDFVLLLEDMRPAEQGDQMAGCDREVARAAVEQAALLHAPRWGDPSLTEHGFLAGVEGAGSLDRSMYDAFWTGFKARYAPELSREQLQVGEALAARWEIYSRGYSGPKTVTHGDFRLDNLLIERSESEVKMTVVDWQTAGLGCGTADVAYFLGAGLKPGDRRRWERELVGAYHDALIGLGVRGYTFDDTWRDYRWFAYSGYVMAVVASMLVEQTERGDHMFMTMAERHTEQILDLDSEAVLA